MTGGTGFIGSRLVRRLIAEGADVHTVTSTVSSLFPIRLVDCRDQITLHEANLCDRSAMDVLARNVKPDVVFHLGAYTHVGKSWFRVDECIQTNVQGTMNLLQALEPVGYERFVFTGTSEIYGGIEVPFVETAKVNPISPYAVSKYAADHYCRLFHEARGWPIVRLRPFNAYGPGQTPDRVVPEIIVRALRRQPLLMTEAKQTRGFNFVDDLADGFVRAAQTDGIEGELFNIGCEEETSIRDLTETILGLMGDPIEPQFGALPERPTEIWRMSADSAKARAQLGWKPSHTLESGLTETIAWYEEELQRPGSVFALGRQ